MSESTLCFVNSSSTNERIMVSDAESAAILGRLLSRLQNEKWEMRSQSTPVEVLQEEFTYELPEALPSVPTSKFRVVLISGTSTFRSSVRDISSEEIVLKCTAPTQFNRKDCLVYVSYNDMRENIEFTATVVTEWNGTSRLVLVRPEAAAIEKLTSWIA